MSPELQELINGLLVKNYKERLGCRGHGYVDVCKCAPGCGRLYVHVCVCLPVCALVRMFLYREF